MKNFKRIGAALLAVAMLCSMSVVAFADDEVVNAVVGSTVADSEIKINGAVVEKSTGILTVTLDYSITGTVEANDQITMLGYIFDGEQSDASQVTVVTGNIRAIDQAAAVKDNGKIVFKLATTGEGYTVAEDAQMVVKLGSNAASVTKAQAFFIDLAAVTDTAPPVVYGDINTDEKVDMKDVGLVFQAAKKKVTLEDLQVLAADVNGDTKVDMKDVGLVFQKAKKKIETFPVEGE